MMEQVFYSTKNGILKATRHLPTESKPLITFVFGAYGIGALMSFRKSQSRDLRHHAGSYMNEFND
ncbi:hypothetical protein BJ944DRAFT_250920 [Cunninghamella echinulata]|nr:hypothetical protein BJ944DRAFT_250920 [Cunninghamella echinulata]